MEMQSKLLRKAATTLYHGSRKSLPVGTILSPRKRGYVQSKDPEVARTEAILERYRPAGTFSRYESVFMSEAMENIEQQGGYVDFLYRVEPIGPTDVNYRAWHAELEAVAWEDEDDPEAVQLAEGYWSGKPKPGARHDRREVRATSARVVSRVRAGDPDHVAPIID